MGSGQIRGIQSPAWPGGMGIDNRRTGTQQGYDGFEIQFLPWRRVVFYLAFALVSNSRYIWALQHFDLLNR
jgi:hypothetical protein